MKNYKNFISENLNSIIKQRDDESASHLEKDPGLYKSLNGKSRLYTSDDHAYFQVGQSVNIPPIYTNITRGVIVHGGKYKDNSVGSHQYVVRATLPEKHPEAVDENGEHTLGSNIKHFGMTAEELTKHNPKSEWDGK